MPFRKHIKVTVANESPTYAVEDFYYYMDWQKHESLPEDTRYFHAQYRQAMPATKGHYAILDTQGQGHYVGTVYSVQQVDSAGSAKVTTSSTSMAQRSRNCAGRGRKTISTTPGVSGNFARPTTA